MRLTKEGIGWLIFGLLVVWSCTETTSTIEALSTIALGGVFILLYLIKQFFKPDGIGWYICGGTLVAFCIESGYNSDTLIALILGAICLFVFYMRNKDSFDELFSGAAMGYMTDPLDDFSYVDPDTYPEPGETEATTETVEVVEEVSVTEQDDTSAEGKTVTDPGDKDAEETMVDPDDVLVEFDLTQKE